LQENVNNIVYAKRAKNKGDLIIKKDFINKKLPSHNQTTLKSRVFQFAYKNELTSQMSINFYNNFK